MFLAIALPGLFVTVVKGLIGRVRPSELGPFIYSPWSWQHEYASLPSGHATAAFAAAIAIGALWPKARVPFWIFAAVIAVSRVVIQAHFVSDVIAAAFVGGFGAILVRNWFAARAARVRSRRRRRGPCDAGSVVAPRQGGCPPRCSANKNPA